MAALAWQVTIAIAATLLAAFRRRIGRWGQGVASEQDVSAATSRRRCGRCCHRRRRPTPDRSGVPLPRPAADTATTDRARGRRPVAPRPARLVDRRTVQADAVFSPSFAAERIGGVLHAEEGSESALKRAEPDDHGELRVATIVDDGVRNYHVRLSPDGKEVAFDSDRDGERGVYVADASGRGVRKVSGDGYAAVPPGRRMASGWRSCAPSRSARRSGTCGCSIATPAGRRASPASSAARSGWRVVRRRPTDRLQPRGSPGHP